MRQHVASIVGWRQAARPTVKDLDALTSGRNLLLQREAGGDVMGIDWRSQLDEAWKILGHNVAIQGNMDPVSIYADLPMLKQRVGDVLKLAGGRPGHIFNLGHGVMPDMNPDHVKAVVEYVHELGGRR